jgi:hypothetical protein
MFLGKAICPLGFSRRGDFIGEGASSGGGPGGLDVLLACTRKLVGGAVLMM